MRKCGKCHAPNDDAATFCANCGKKIPPKWMITTRNVAIGFVALAVLSGIVRTQSPEPSGSSGSTDPAPTYETATTLSYVELFEDFSDFKGDVVSFSGPVDSVYDDYFTISEHFTGLSHLSVRLHSSQVMDVTEGEYVTVCGVAGSKIFGIADIQDAIIVGRGESSQYEYDMLYAYYKDKLAREAAESEEQKQADIAYSKENDYTPVSISSMYNELDANALRAEQTYQNAMIKITGYIRVIDSDGAYISVTQTNGSLDFQSVHCSLRTDEQRKTIISKNIGDEVTVWGKISSVGEILGYSLRVDFIE